MAHTTTLFVIINNKKTNNMATIIAPGQTVTGTLTIHDDVTNLEVTGWFTGISIVSSDSTKATAAPNLSSTSGKYIDFTGIANGSATITINCTANYNDSNGNAAAKSMSAIVPIQVASEPHATSLKVVF
jgi:hypothetical protein